MTKAEIIEAINSTIVANGQKGITAESLANILIEMASATPEGGSGGSGGALFYAGVPNEDFTAFNLTAEELEHNAAMYNTFVTSNAVPVSIDMTRYYLETMAAGGLPEGITSENIKMYTTSMEVSFASEEAAAIMGSPYYGIMLTELQAVIQSDGSLVMMPQE